MTNINIVVKTKTYNQLWETEISFSSRNKKDSALILGDPTERLTE